MEEIILYVKEKLPIIIAYLIVFAECIGQIFLKKFVKKDGNTQRIFVTKNVKSASDDLTTAKNELLRQKAEWDKDKVELHKIIDRQSEKIDRFEKILKTYANHSKGKEGINKTENKSEVKS